MLNNLVKLWKSVTEWLPVLYGLILAAEASQTGTGADKKAKVLADITDVLDDTLDWVTQAWAQAAFGAVINLVVWVLNKNPDWVSSVADFIPASNDS